MAAGTAHVIPVPLRSRVQSSDGLLRKVRAVRLRRPVAVYLRRSESPLRRGGGAGEPHASCRAQATLGGNGACMRMTGHQAAYIFSSHLTTPALTRGGRDQGGIREHLVMMRTAAGRRPPSTTPRHDILRIHPAGHASNVPSRRCSGAVGAAYVVGRYRQLLNDGHSLLRHGG